MRVGPSLALEGSVVTLIMGGILAGAALIVIRRLRMQRERQHRLEQLRKMSRDMDEARERMLAVRAAKQL